MNAVKEWAEKLNNRQYMEELTCEEERELKEQGLVVVIGASDDLCEMRGAINDEINCYDGGEFYINKNGFVICTIEECPECPVHGSGCAKQCEEKQENATKLIITWGGDYSWTYEIDVPHSAFTILEDDEWYCKGIVFRVKDLEG